jgi:tetratricopeptide (TPR) repeat protein
MDQIDALLDKAAEFIRHSQYREALSLLEGVSDNDRSHWNVLYLTGQCHRFLDNFERAIFHLKQAASAAPTSAPVFLALGIAHQLQGELEQARVTLFHAIEIDPDYALAFNSLALTQKMLGEFDKALHNYDAGCMALARRFIKGLSNDRRTRILKHRDTRGDLWMNYAVYGATWNVAEGDLAGVAFPDGQSVVEEERTEAHAGLFWTDLTNQDGKTTRLFFPNYFNTFREDLRNDATYANLLGNRGTVLELMDRHVEARAHFDEAEEFLPIGNLPSLG